MLPFRVYLLSGLVAHKLVWEVWKRHRRVEPKPVPSLTTRLVKIVKLGILAGVVVQTALPWDVASITNEPFMIRAIGVVLYTIGLGTAIVGRIQLGDSWSDIETPRAERDTVVVSRGLYRFIRHPIYSGDLMLLLGLELAVNSWLVLVVLAMIPAVFYRAIREEQMLAQRVAGYDTYLRGTKRFIPFVV